MVFRSPHHEHKELGFPSPGTRAGCSSPSTGGAEPPAPACAERSREATRENLVRTARAGGPALLGFPQVVSEQMNSVVPLGSVSGVTELQLVPCPWQQHVGGRH